MSTDRESFLQSLANADVESVLVSREAVGDAIDAFVVGEAVGIAAEEWGAVPDSVEWNPTPADLRDADTGVTAAAFAVDGYGSLVLPSSPPANELLSLYVDRHIAVVSESDIVPDMTAAFDRLDSDIPGMYRDAIIATGPSATADMGALVKGAHGPSEVRLVVLEEE